MKQDKIDPQVYELYDEYCHSAMSRRDFLNRASTLAVIGGSGVAMAEALLPTYAEAHEVEFTDPRIKASYVEYDSPGGNSGTMRGYLVKPEGDGPFPAVIVIHENRGLNPYIEDVARRLAVDGFLTLAPDGLYPVGGYPGNDDDGKVMQKNLDQTKLYVDLVNSAHYVKSHELSTGKLGATGFCFGGGTVNKFVITLEDKLQAAVPYYGKAPKDLAGVSKITSPIMMQLAEDDPRVNATMPDYEKALADNGKDHVFHTYPGTRHGFHNYSTPRYNEKQANLAWERTVAFFKQHLV